MAVAESTTRDSMVSKGPGDGFSVPVTPTGEYGRGKSKMAADKSRERELRPLPFKSSPELFF